MALDIWEHAYYLKYKNDRANFIEAFWHLVNRDTANSRFVMHLKKIFSTISFNEVKSDN